MSAVLSFWFPFKCDKSIPAFPFLFPRVRKGARINFHYMYTEIIKCKFTLEGLPIPVTPVCLNCQGLFLVLINWLREQQSFVLFVKSLGLVQNRLLLAMGEAKQKPLS